MSKVAEELHGAGEYTCDCGRTFTHGAWYAKHKLHCEGKPATEGRIAARQKSLVPVSRPHVRRQKRNHPERTPPAIATHAIVAAATDKAIEIVLAGLRAKRDQIDAAIDALEAIG